MTYERIRKTAKTGDVLAVRGSGVIGSLIRVLTGEGYSHVALLVWLDDGLYVFEFVEGTGYQSMPASEWLRRRSGQALHFGVAPRLLRDAAPAVALAALKYRKSSVASRWYGYLSLVKVFLSQLTGKKIPVRQKVCSTFVQECWQAGNYQLAGTADPGDVVNACSATHAIYQELP